MRGDGSANPNGKEMDPGRYLSRIGVDPDGIGEPDLGTLERLQRAHATTVPFETLSITGDPFGDGGGEGVSLALPDLYGKIVDRRRGGYCFELNGLFGWLLRELGFDVDRLSARVLGEDGDRRPPANHHTLRVWLDRPYLVDVGLGSPRLRRPLPFDGAVRSDAAGIDWRVAGSDRPDADHTVRTREPGEDGWTIRYDLRTEPRELRFFEATCEYLATAPESPFTGDPVVIVATERGYAKLSPGTLTRVTGGDERERSIDRDEWYDLLEREFGIRYPA